MSRKSFVTLASLVLVSGSAFAQSPCTGTIVDSFSGADGSAPNPVMWAANADCSQYNVNNTCENGTLTQTSSYLNNCAQGCVGSTIYSKFEFHDFDMSIDWVSTDGGKYASFGVLAPQSLPPSSFCTSPPPPIICVVRIMPGFVLQVMPGYPEVITPLDANNQPYIVSPNSTFRLVGIRGDSLRVYVNGTLIFERLGWDLGVDSVVAFIASQSGEIAHSTHTTKWDNFKLFPIPSMSPPTLNPNRGGTKGGQLISILGSNLDSLTGVSFGGTAGTIVSKSATVVTVIAPQGPACRTNSTADVCLSTATETCCLTDAWTWVPALSVLATWQPNSTVLLTLTGNVGSSFLLFAGSGVLPCPGFAAPPSVDHFLLAGPVISITTLPNSTGTLFFGAVLPASWPPGVSVALQAAEVPSQGSSFQLTNVQG